MGVVHLRTCFVEAKGVFDREPGDIDPPDGFQIRRLRSPPPEPERHRSFGGFGEMLHLQSDERPADERAGLARAPLGVHMGNGMEPAPALEPHPPIVGIGGLPLGCRRGPGRWVNTGELRPMPTRPSSGRSRWRISIEGPLLRASASGPPPPLRPTLLQVVPGHSRHRR